MKHMRTIASLSLALALVVPGVASAANVTEQLNIASTITMTVPVSPVVYGQGKAINTATIDLTNVATDSPRGLTIELAVNAGDTGKITPSSRSLGAVTAISGWTNEVARSQPFGTNDAAPVGPIGIAYVDHAVNTPVSLSFDSIVNATNYVPGSYSGTLTFTATAN